MLAVVYLLPIGFIALAFWLHTLPSVISYQSIVIMVLALLLGVWSGLMGLNTYGIFSWLGFLFNPLVVGLLTFRRPVFFGLLTNLINGATTMGVLFFWRYRFDSFEGALQFCEGWGGMLGWPLLGAAISLIVTIPIFLYRRKHENGCVV